MFLVDTDVLSTLLRRDRNPQAVGRVEAQRTWDLFISLVTVGKIERGIEQQKQPNPGLALWLGRTLSWYGNHILPVDTATARRWGQLSTTNGNDGADHLITATALENGLTLVTRNVHHFEPTGVPVVNPFD